MTVRRSGLRVRTQTGDESMRQVGETCHDIVAMEGEVRGREIGRFCLCAVLCRGGGMEGRRRGVECEGRRREGGKE